MLLENRRLPNLARPGHQDNFSLLQHQIYRLFNFALDVHRIASCSEFIISHKPKPVKIGNRTPDFHS